MPQELTPAPGMFGDARLTLVAGSRDRYATDALERLAGELEALGVACRFERFTGGHRLDDDTLRRIVDDG